MIHLRPWPPRFLFEAKASAEDAAEEALSLWNQRVGRVERVVAEDTGMKDVQKHIQIISDFSIYMIYIYIYYIYTWF